MLLQANDFDVLLQDHGCELQVGGSDQWGNITAGIDLIRRRRGAKVHGLTVPLVTRSDGAKFGKSVDGAVWLSAERTSPYAFYQYWINTDDADVERFLLQLTLLAVDEVAVVAADHAVAPQRRDGQRRVAHEVTTLVHGEPAARAAAAASQLLFGGDPAAAGDDAFEMLAGELGGVDVSSLGEARRGPRRRRAGGPDRSRHLAERCPASAGGGRDPGERNQARSGGHRRREPAPARPVPAGAAGPQRCAIVVVVA